MDCKVQIVNCYLCLCVVPKDGGQVVIVSQEIAFKPGLAVWQVFYDPKTSPEIKILNNEVIEYPNEVEFEVVTLRVSSVEERNDRLFLKNAEKVA